MNVVIYARYSSDKQREQSIEGQLKACRCFAKMNGYAVIHEYIDRGKTGRSDNRAAFQKMIADSGKNQFEGVIVYTLDRFSRDKYDNAVYKRRLEQNGVRVISAKEYIADGPTGIITESVLEALAEYYSLELSQKVRRGMSINAEKCIFNGGTVPFGYQNVDKHLVLNEETAPYVKIIFEKYASGTRASEIAEYLNERHIKTSTGVEFNKNSLHSILKNKKYIGFYTYDGKEIPNGVPRIISDELFYRVQEVLVRNKANAGHNKAKTDYILTTKLFCGYCRSPMVGTSAKSCTGRIYYYYSCNKARNKGCDMKNKRKEMLESIVLKKCREMLNDRNISLIAKAVADTCKRKQDDSELRRLTLKLKEVDRAINNLLLALENGENADLICERITHKRQEKQMLESDIAAENLKHIFLSEDEIRFFLTQFKKGKVNSKKYQRLLISIFVNAVYVYDDHLTIVFNASDNPVTIDGIRLEEIEENFGGKSFLDSAADGSPRKDAFGRLFSW